MTFARAFTFAILPAALAVSGCTNSLRADVTRFQQLPVPQGQTFTVQAAEPSLNDSIEFQTYAQLVSNALTAEGYRPAAAPGTADLIVSMDYGVDQGREKVVADYDPFWGAGAYGWSPFYRYPYRGYYGRRYVYGFHDPFLFGGGFGGGFGGTSVRSYTVFTGGLELTIDRAADSRRLFEGRAEAMSRSNNLTYLVPNLIEAMFTGFPGNSGETVKITVAPEKS